jgi:serine/threonine protein kinase
MTSQETTNLPPRLGNYELLELIGRGSFSAVRRARQRDGQIAAVKVLDAARTLDQASLLQFYQGAKLAMMFDHPHLVKTFEVGCDRGIHYVAMEYVPGGNLAQFIQESGWMYEEQALRMIIEIADGLAELHARQIVHRDVNPANILLFEDQRPMLADFGLAQSPGEDLGLGIRRRPLTTAVFAAPEQFESGRLVGPEADVYGLGATLFAMVTGRLPFPPRSPARILSYKKANIYRRPDRCNPYLHPATLRLLRKAMQSDPARRPADAQLFQAMAEKCLRKIESEGSTAATPRAIATTMPKDGLAEWHILVPDSNGRPQRVSGTVEELIALIELDKVGPEVPAARRWGGPYVPLCRIARFRRLFERKACGTRRWHLPDAVKQIQNAIENIASCLRFDRLCGMRKTSNLPG